MAKPTDQIRELARLGASARLKEIADEVATINRAFPGLGRVSEIPFPTRRRKRRKMSAAARAAVSKRMKAYWAARRKAKKS